MDILDTLEQTFDHTHAVIAAIRPDQLDDKTPCPEWTVRDVLAHLTGVVDALGAAAAGLPPREFELGADPAAQFQAVAAAALQAWRAPGVLESTVVGRAGPMPGHVWAGINLLDTATHTWDLATATGQPAELPDAVAAAALEASKSFITPELRPGRFDDEVPVPADATATEALVAYLGRRS